MTVIVAARTGDAVTLACDEQTSWGWLKDYTDRPKLWVDGAFVVGGAGSVRAAQVVRHFTTWPKFRPYETTWERFLVREAVPAIRKGAEGQGVTKSDSGVETIGTTLLVATGRVLAEVSGNGAVSVSRSGRWAIGSGANEALGYLGDTGPWEPAHVIEAARRATLTDAGCSGRILFADTVTLKVEVAP